MIIPSYTMFNLLTSNYFSYLLLKLHNVIYFLTTAFVDVVSGTVHSEVASAGKG